MAYPLTSLANLYREQGKYEKRSRSTSRPCTSGSRQLGPEHPDVAYNAQ